MPPKGENPPAGEQAGPAHALPNAAIPEYIQRYANCLADLNTAKLDLKTLDEQAKEDGLNPKAMRKVVMILADDTGKAKLKLQDELWDIFQYMRSAGEPLEVE